MIDCSNQMCGYSASYSQWRSYTRAHPGTGPGINPLGPGIKNWQESRDYLLINGS